MTYCSFCVLVSDGLLFILCFSVRWPTVHFVFQCQMAYCSCRVLVSDIGLSGCSSQSCSENQSYVVDLLSDIVFSGYSQSSFLSDIDGNGYSQTCLL